MALSMLNASSQRTTAQPGEPTHLLAAARDRMVTAALRRSVGRLMTTVDEERTFFAVFLAGQQQSCVAALAFESSGTVRDAITTIITVPDQLLDVLAEITAACVRRACPSVSLAFCIPTLWKPDLNPGEQLLESLRYELPFQGVAVRHTHTKWADRVVTHTSNGGVQ